MNAAHLAQALKAKRNGSGWMARCPAHNDHRASLSIGEGEDGRLLLHCHAGCAFDAILKAAGVEPTKANGEDRGKPRIVATYDYHDAAGTLAYQVVRYDPKDFRQRRPDGHGDWIWNMKGVERAPYRLPELLNASEVFICEGEKDCDNLARLGLVATTNPGGADKDGEGGKKWPEAFARYFDGRHVVLIPDNDENGRRHVQAVAKKLSGAAASIKVLDLPNLPPKGDVSDWLAAGGSAQQLIELADHTPYWDPHGAPQGNAPKVVHFREFVASFVPPQYEIDGLLQRGRIYSVTAPTGHGKTAVCMCLETHLGLGQDLGQRRVEQGNAVYFAAENPEDVKARAILMASRLGSDLPVYFVEGGFNIDDWADHIRAQVEAIGGAASLTIDTGPAFLAACGFADENDNLQALRFALKLRQFTKLPGNPVVLVPTHPIKNAGKDNLIPRGGSAFLNEMDGNLTLWADGDRDTTELHWLGKLRGPSFDPITFALEKGTCPELVDAKGRLIPSVWATLASAERAERASARQRDDEDAILITLNNAPVGSIATWATSLGWILHNGEPAKSRVYRGLERLKAEKLVAQKRGRWVLTPSGKKEAERLQDEAQ